MPERVPSEWTKVRRSGERLGNLGRPIEPEDPEPVIGVRGVPRPGRRPARFGGSTRQDRTSLPIGALTDLHRMPLARGDWIGLGIADQQEPAAAATSEA